MNRLIKSIVYASAASLIVPVSVLGQSQSAPQTSDAKALEGAVSLAQSLTQWAFLIVGGSIVILVGTSYYRPINWPRFFYLLFIPAWFCLFGSIYSGVQVQRAYLSFLFFTNHINIDYLRSTINRGAGQQISRMMWGLGFLAMWLFAYLLWWVISPKVKDSTASR